MNYTLTYVPETLANIHRLPHDIRAELDALLLQLSFDPYTDTEADPRSKQLRRARTGSGLHVLLSVSGERPLFLDPSAFWEPTLNVVSIDIGL